MYLTNIFAILSVVHKSKRNKMPQEEQLPRCHSHCSAMPQCHSAIAPQSYSATEPRCHHLAPASKLSVILSPTNCEQKNLPKSITIHQQIAPAQPLVNKKFYKKIHHQISSAQTYVEKFYKTHQQISCKFGPEEKLGAL